MITEKMGKECTDRLHILQDMGLWDEVVKQWESNNTVCLSEAMHVLGDLSGINFTFDEVPGMKEIKEKFEKETGYVVYYGVLSKTGDGRMLSLLFVSEDEEDWEYEREDLQEGYPVAYVWNIDYEFGESGSIGIQVLNGGAVRTM